MYHAHCKCAINNHRIANPVEQPLFRIYNPEGLNEGFVTRSSGFAIRKELIKDL
jgi:hypothetical protein